MARTAIMLKFSDVLNDGERAPKNYYEQALRCGDDRALNVFASINNRWIIGDDAMHAALEAEFLSPSIVTKTARFRARLPLDSVIFTRAGALLNLKVLLGLEPRPATYREHAVGAVALHANDYVESPNEQPITSGALPVVAEFAPVWELQNIREPMQLLRRSFFIYSTLLQRDARMQTLFEKPIGELDFSGLPFHKYFPLLFGIYTVTRNGVLDPRFPTSIPPAAEVAQQAGVTVEQFTTFAAAKAMTVDDARAAFGPLDQNAFVARVTGSRWTSDQRPFRNRPLLRLSDDRFLTLDLQFLFESTSSGLSWSLVQRLNGKSRDHFFEYWGHLFEEYAQLMLAHYYSGSVKRKYDTDGQIDGFVPLGADVLLVEVKAGFLREEAKGSRDPKPFDDAVREKYVTNTKGDRKGARQLAASIAAILDGKLGVYSGRIYPVLVGEDPVLQTIAMNTYLNDIFRAEVNVGDRVAPLTVMLIDELELVLPYIAAGDMTWQELLTARFVGDRVAKDSVHEVFNAIAVSRHFKHRQETFLAAQAEPLIAMIKDAYENLK